MLLVQNILTPRPPAEGSPLPPRIPTRPGRSPPSVLDGIPLSGLPWPPAGTSSATFGLAPHGSAVSSRVPPTSGSPHHRPWWAGSRFCSGADRLRSRLLAPCVLPRGRNFPRRSPWPVHRLGSAPPPAASQLTVSGPRKVVYRAMGGGGIAILGPIRGCGP